jgi:hypothetical protein
MRSKRANTLRRGTTAESRTPTRELAQSIGYRTIQLVRSMIIQCYWTNYSIEVHIQYSPVQLGPRYFRSKVHGCYRSTSRFMCCHWTQLLIE